MKKPKQKKKTKTKKKQKASEWRSSADVGLFDPSATKKIAKVRITTYIDSDILSFLKNKSAQSTEGYQTLLNKILRDGMSVGQPILQEQMNELRKLMGHAAPSNVNLTVNLQNKIIVAQDTDATNDSDSELINLRNVQ